MMSANPDQSVASRASTTDLAPSVFRQRLLVEGFFTGRIDENRVRRFLTDLAAALDLRIYGEPVVFTPASGMGRDDNAGFDAFVPLIDSGISAYFWTAPSFFSVVLFTCKGFDEDTAIARIAALLGVEDEVVSHAF